MLSSYPASELLMGIAQISIAFVGFAAIVEVVRERERDRSQFENLLARTMIEFGFSALFLALLPLLISRFLEPFPNAAWQSLSGVLAAVLTLHLAVYSRRRRRVDQAAFLMPGVYRAWKYGSGAVVLALGGGAANLLLPSGVYLAGLAWLLISGSISFIVIVSVLE